jgi:hypothetical protein
MKAKRMNKKQALIRKEARRLLRDPKFLYRVGRKIRELGVVDETRNGQILYLAGLTKDLDAPVSILTKGESG